MKRFFLLFTLGGMISGSAQILDARSDLMQPVNPPRSSIQKREPSKKPAEGLGTILIRKSFELEMHRRKGLGERHPTIMALKTQLMAIAGQMKENADAIDQYVVQQEMFVREIWERLNRSQAAEIARRQANEQEILKLRDEVARLKDELNKVREEP